MTRCRFTHRLMQRSHRPRAIRAFTGADAASGPNREPVLSAGQGIPGIGGTDFLDRSVIEVLANDRTLLSERIYPSRPDSLGVSVFAAGGAITVKRLDAWTMAPVMP